MPRRFFNDGQELVFEDMNAQSAALERGLYDRFFKELVQRQTDAFFGDSFNVSFSTSTSVNVAAGLGVQEDTSQTTPEPIQRPLYLSSPAALSISAPDAALNRIDIVCVSHAMATELSALRKFKDSIGGSISLQTLVTQKDWSATLSIVAGTPNASPVAPATPSGKIKLADLYVTAVTGLAGSGAVTDDRDLMPVGGEALLDTLGYVRLTAGAAVSLETLLAEVDAYIKHGYAEYIDFDDLSVDPSAPLAASNKQRVYFKGGVAFYRSQAPGGAITPLGSGGGGGGGLVWHALSGQAPIESEENSNQVFLFDPADSQKMAVWLKVPTSYLSGRQIKMKIGVYSPSTSLNVLMRSVATLIRKNLDAASSTTNQRTSTNTQLTNSVANQYREVELDLTSSTGTINSVAVSAGDMIKVELDRNVASETSSDTADTRFMPTATEVTFQ